MKVITVAENGEYVEKDIEIEHIKISKREKDKLDMQVKIELKKRELKKAKEGYLKQPIIVNNKSFISSLDAYTKYKIAYDLGVKKGLTKGKVICLVDGKPTWTEITKDEMDEYFLKFEEKGYKAERQLGKLLELIAKAKTKEDVEKINWENPN